MPPRKNASAALKRQAPVLPPARFGIQHFFSRHSENTQTVMHQTAPASAPTRSTSVLSAFSRPTELFGAHHVQEQVACSTASGAGLEAKQVEIEVNGKNPLPEDNSRAVSHSSLQQKHPPSQSKMATSWKLLPHSGDPVGASRTPVQEVNFSSKESFQQRPTSAKPPSASKENQQSPKHSASQTPAKRKRPRYSPEMMVIQSQDDGGDEVVWKASPTAHRLLAAAINQPSAGVSGQRPVLHPCNKVGNSEALQDFLTKGSSMTDSSSAKIKKKSPGLAGKLETWLSSSMKKTGDHDAHQTPKVAKSGNKENVPIVCSTTEKKFTFAGFGNALQGNGAMQLPASTTPKPQSCQSSTVPGQSVERSRRKGTKKQSHSGQRRKALLDLLDKVEDAIILQEQEPEGICKGGNDRICDTTRSSVQEDTVGNMETVSPEHLDHPNEVNGLLDSRSLIHKCNESSQAVKGSESGEPLKACIKHSSLLSASGRVELLAADSATLNVSAPPLSPTAEEKRSSLSRAQIEEQIRTCVDATDCTGAVAHQDLGALVLHDAIKPDHLANIHFLVLEVAEAGYQEYKVGPELPQKILRLLNEQSGIERVVYLRDAWSDSVVRPGDTVNVIGDFKEDGTCVIDTAENLMVLHPDILVSGSRVGVSFSCPRRAVLDERIKSSDVSGAALMGTLLHQLFQVALLSHTPTRNMLESEVEAILHRNIDGLYVTGGSEKEAKNQLLESIPTILNWLQQHVYAKPATNSKVEGGKVPLSICEVMDIEETIWSPKFGLKGMIDASVRVIGQPHVRSMPLELKTGKVTTGMAAMEHRAQVFLYGLLMSDRYAERIQSGVLYYMHTNETQDITVDHKDLIGLMMRRNEHASSLLSVSGTQSLPPMLKSMHMCRGCRHLDVCTVYHKVHEDGTSKSSGLGDLFDARTDHLTTAHSEFLRLWDYLIDLEAQDVQASHREIWRMNSKQREVEGRCLAFLTLDITARPPQAQHSDSNRRIYCFRKVNESRCSASEPSDSFLERPFSCGDFVILSTESGQVAVAVGVIASIAPNSVFLSLPHRLRLPSKKPGTLEADTLSQEVWRIDKDETVSGVALMRYNVLQLFVKQSGNENLRRLTVDLETPKFERGSLMSQDPASLYIKSVSSLNDDQRSAIHKIVAAKDYALVLGMPGTGKTCLIIHAVKALLTRGCSILLTSYTNSAVDNILLKLKAEEVDFLRVGRYEAIHPELQGYALSGPDIQVASVEELELKIQRARVVGVTCLGITHALFSKRKFDVCIVDEAGQITLPVCLGPLHCAEKFVLVGDHYQLPPLVRNADARKKGMAISLFRRLCEAHPQAVSALQNQYRMCADIMALCNVLIYGNRLQCGSDEIANAQLELQNYPGSLPRWLVQVLDPVRRVLFLDTDALPAEESRMRKALHNVAECSLVMEVSKALIECGIDIQDIGIISPYNAQVDSIRRLASEAGVSSLEVHTVDKYQGRDKDCVVVSFVRSNASTGRPQPGILLADWHRINVAITRAKKKLILIGSLRTLSTTPVLSLLISQVRELGGLIQLPPVISSSLMLRA